MIKDKESGETYHPSTYYVFADDEPEVLSNAALHALDAFTPQAIRDAEAKALVDGTAREEERYILVNMGPSGTNVVGARSLAPTWAVTNARVRAAPTFDGGDGEGSDGLMLMVEGKSSSTSAVAPTSKTANARRAQAQDALDGARKRNAGNIITAMEELAQEMMSGIRTLDQVTTTD